MDKATVKIVTKDGRPIEILFDELKDIMLRATAQGLNKCMDIVGVTAVGKYMIATHGILDAAARAVDPFRLTVRTGRLARSIKNTYRYTESGLPTFLGAVTGEKPRTIRNIGGKKEGFREIKYTKGRGIIAIMGTHVEYAARHEYGEGIRKRPYLNPALEETESRFGHTIQGYLDRAIQKTDWA